MDNATIGTGVQDIFSIKTPASKGAQLHHVQLSAAAVTAVAEVRMRLKRGTATVTLGSGGTAPTAAIVDPGDTQVAASTCHINDTTQATTSGVFTALEFHQWNVLLPFDYMPGPEDEDRDACDVSQALILDLPAAISPAVVASGFFKFRELP
jgi:hypothetical protein